MQHCDVITEQRKLSYPWKGLRIYIGRSTRAKIEVNNRAMVTAEIVDQDGDELLISFNRRVYNGSAHGGAVGYSSQQTTRGKIYAMLNISWIDSRSDGSRLGVIRSCLFELHRSDGTTKLTASAALSGLMAGLRIANEAKLDITGHP